MRGGRGDVTEKYRILGAVVGTGKELLSFSFSSLGLQAYGSMREIFTFRDVHEAEKKTRKKNVYGRRKKKSIAWSAPRKRALNKKLLQTYVNIFTSRVMDP